MLTLEIVGAWPAAVGLVELQKHTIILTYTLNLIAVLQIHRRVGKSESIERWANTLLVFMGFVEKKKKKEERNMNSIEQHQLYPLWLCLQALKRKHMHIHI